MGQRLVVLHLPLTPSVQILALRASFWTTTALSQSFSSGFGGLILYLLCVYIYICMWYQCLSMKYDFISALTAVASNYKLCLILHHLILSFIPVFMLHIAVETKPAQLTLEFLAFQCYVLAAASALHGQHESSVLSLLIFSLPVPALLLPGFTWALEKGGIIGMRNKAELLFLTCLTPL